jgi:hypothetical protein
MIASTINENPNGQPPITGKSDIQGNFASTGDGRQIVKDTPY